MKPRENYSNNNEKFSKVLFYFVIGIFYLDQTKFIGISNKI